VVVVDQRIERLGVACLRACGQTPIFPRIVSGRLHDAVLLML